jgi:hypothetical protein
MKIDILRKPQADIFKNRGNYVKLFSLFLVVAAIGLLLGAYTYLSNTPYYVSLEKVSMILFAGSSLPIFIFGEKLQGYKRLTPPQKKELENFCQNNLEIREFCRLVTKLGRPMILAEFNACTAFAEEREMQEEQARQKALQ